MAETSKQDVDFLEQFEPDVFWQKYGRLILWGVGALAAIGIIAYYSQEKATQAQADAAYRLSQANDPAALQSIAKEFSTKPIGAQALLRLGELHFAAGRLGEANGAYQELISRYPSNPLAEPARLSVVAILEAQGNFEAAKTQYLQLALKSGSYLASAAKLGAARCMEALGQTKEAKQLYEELMQVTRGSGWEVPVFIRHAVLGRTVTNMPAAPVAGLPGLKIGN